MISNSHLKIVIKYLKTKTWLVIGFAFLCLAIINPLYLNAQHYERMFKLAFYCSYSYETAGAIYTWDSRTRVYEQISAIESPKRFVTWSHSGDAILYVVNSEFMFRRDSSLYRMDADGSNVELLVRHRNSSIRDPVWSPDDNSIAYVHEDLSQSISELYIWNEQTNSSHLVLESELYLQYLDWSPDGNWITYVYGTARNKYLYKIRPDASDSQVITPSFVSISSPAWSPDSQWIAFIVERKYLYRLDINSLTYTLLATNEIVRDPSWSPNSDIIAVSSRAAVDSPAKILLANSAGEINEIGSNGGGSTHFPEFISENQIIYRYGALGETVDAFNIRIIDLLNGEDERVINSDLDCSPGRMDVHIES